MSICTMIVDCGPLGEIEWTISYRYHRGYRKTSGQPEEPATVTIGWVKIGGENGTEVFPCDEYIRDEVIPHCVEDYEGAGIENEWRAAA